MKNISKKKLSRKHGSPYDRGSADRYYQRKYEPHWWPEGTGKGLKITEEVMHEDELLEYYRGWHEEEERKDYG